MSLFIKIAAAILGLLILLVGGVAIYLSTVFNANDYKAEIQALIKQQTQLELKIDGELELSVFPWLGVSVEDTSINSPGGHLASAGYARIFAKFAPLLKGQVEVDGIALRDIKLHLIKDAKGRGNWQFNTADKSKADTSSSQSTEISVADFALGYLQIENAEVSYRDLATGDFHQFQNMDFRVNNVSSNSDFPISADFQYLNNDLNTPTQAHLTSQISLNLNKQKLSLSDTVLDIGSTRITSVLEIQHLLKAPFIDGHINITELKPADWSGVLQQPALADIALDLDLKSDFQVDTGKGQLAFQEMTLTGSELELKGAMNVNGLNDKLSYLGKLTVHQLNPNALLTSMGIDTPSTAKTNVLKSLTGQLDFKGSDQDFQLSNINLKLDDSTLKGSAGINSFSSLASRFALTIDSLNLDNYLPTDTTASTANQETQGNVSTAEAQLLPLDTLRDLKTQGHLRIGTLVASGHQIDNFDANISANNGFINLKSLTGNLYDGTLSSSASIDARGKIPQINFNKQLTGIQAAPLLTSLAEVDYVDGIMDLQINATTYGNTLTAIKKTIIGEVNFKVTDGLLKNTNIEQLVCKSIARIRDRNYSATEDQPNTHFKEFNGHMNIVKGVMQTDRLQIALNTLQVNGSGVINLPEDTLDYSIRAKIQGDLENQACEVHERYRDIAWPLRCKGNFSDELSDLCGLDQRELQNIVAQLAKKEVQHKVNNKLEEKLKDKLGREAAEQLRGLLGF